MRKSLVSAGALLSVSAILLTGCTDNPKNNASSSNSSGGTSNDGNISVTSTDTACKLSATETKAGKVTFKVKNEGTKVTEFYVLGSDGLRIISEVENIGPNLTRELVVDLPEGSYKTACKPGMVGDGIQGDFKVTKNENAKPVAEDIQKLRDTASTQYASYVKDQVESLQTKTEEFAKLYAEGKTEEAKAKYALARLHYERIEPVAEKYGTSLDQNLDAREADLQEGKISEWSGWHKIEKDLWQPKADKNDGKEYTPLTQDERKKVADQLVKDTKELYDHVHSEKFAQPTARKNCWTRSYTPRPPVRKKTGRTPTSTISKAILTALRLPMKTYAPSLRRRTASSPRILRASSRLCRLCLISTRAVTSSNPTRSSARLRYVSFLTRWVHSPSRSPS